MTGTKEQAVLEEIARDPNRSSYQIAEALENVSHAWVCKVARRHEIKLGRLRSRSGIEGLNVRWLEAQAREAGCTYAEMLNAIVTDARLDAEEANA